MPKGIPLPYLKNLLGHGPTDWPPYTNPPPTFFLAPMTSSLSVLSSASLSMSSSSDTLKESRPTVFFKSNASPLWTMELLYGFFKSVYAVSMVF